MSTLNTTNLKNESSVTNNIVLGADGSVGVGGTPSQTLDVVGSIEFGSSSNGLITEDGTQIVFKANNSGRQAHIMTHDGAEDINLDPSGFIQFECSGSERMRIDSSGRLLVGTSTTVASSSDIEGGFQHQGVTSSYANANLGKWTNDSGGYALYFGKSRGTSVGSHTIVQNDDMLGYLAFEGSDGTALKRAAAIFAQVDGTPGANDMPGRLSFSTTADGASSPTERMRIRQDGLTALFSNGEALHVSTAATGSSDTALVVRNGATGVLTGTNKFVVRADGDCENTNNSYGSLSDIKLKENIVDATSQWSDIKALQVRKYNFKEGQTHTQIGLIAQEVELVSPGLVSESPDRDEDGNDLGTVTKSVNYSVLYMKAVKALQEAMERIEQLETEMAEVKAQLS